MKVIRAASEARTIRNSLPKAAIIITVLRVETKKSSKI